MILCEEEICRRRVHGTVKDPPMGPWQ